jgi:DNA-nicking Smr family endonuclease
MSKKHKIDQKDLEAFYEAVKGIKPITQGKVLLSPPKQKIKPQKAPPEPEPQYFHGGEPRDLVQGDDCVKFKRDGIADKILRKLGKGQYNVEAVLDLHKMTTDEASSAVNSFLHQCVLRKIKSAIIIHGKGMPGSTPILKNQLNLWLRQTDVVLAFTSAPPRMGGTGAVIILLKSS